MSGGQLVGEGKEKIPSQLRDRSAAKLFTRIIRKIVSIDATGSTGGTGSIGSTDRVSKSGSGPTYILVKKRYSFYHLCYDFHLYFSDS